MNKYTAKAELYFKSKNLNYSKIYAGDLFVLTVMLKNEFKKAGKKPMHFSTRGIKKRTNDSILCCDICAGYFRKKVRIRFSPNGYIKFAKQENADMILKAFLCWCDYLVTWEEWAVWQRIKEDNNQ